MLSKAASSTIFWVFGMTRLGSETWSLGPMANTLCIRPKAWIRQAYTYVLNVPICLNELIFLFCFLSVSVSLDILILILNFDEWKRDWIFSQPPIITRNLYGVMLNALDYGLVVSEFKLYSYYCVHFRTNSLGKNMKLLAHQLCFK